MSKKKRIKKVHELVFVEEGNDNVKHIMKQEDGVLKVFKETKKLEFVAALSALPEPIVH